MLKKQKKLMFVKSDRRFNEFTNEIQKLLIKNKNKTTY